LRTVFSATSRSTGGENGQRRQAFVSRQAVQWLARQKPAGSFDKTQNRICAETGGAGCCAGATGRAQKARSRLKGNPVNDGAAAKAAPFFMRRGGR
jgi:hypothetical protein